MIEPYKLEVNNALRSLFINSVFYLRMVFQCLCFGDFLLISNSLRWFEKEIRYLKNEPFLYGNFF